MRGVAIASIAALFCVTVGATAASACDMSNSMTDPSCANEGFPNVFNNPQNASSSDDDEPPYAINLPGLLAGDGSPIICRVGYTCPGDPMAPPPRGAVAHVRPTEATTSRHTRHARRSDMRRQHDAALR